MTPSSTLDSNPETADSAHNHEHAEDIGCVAIRCRGGTDDTKFNRWLTALVSAKGRDLLRIKGVLHIAGQSRRFVFHGVHMTLEVCLDRTLQSWILSFGPSARVIAPEGLATDIAAQIERARARYQKA